jgi:3-oxoacyl-[acyl-carrier protein] reductase
MSSPSLLLPLAGRVAFVTGAGQGLGAAIARGLVQAGARVALADIDRGNAESVAAELGGLALRLDVRDEAAFTACFDEAVAHFGAVDIMVNNAARTPMTSLWDISPDEWDDVLAINLRGSFFGCRIAGRHMRERGSGRIVNLASMAGQQASAATGVHYAASKAGLLALTRSFAQELAPHGVTVNALAPAAIDSPALDAIDPSRQQALKVGIPLGRFGFPEEVAAAVVYLASPAAAFMTGATLDLNGGRFMR